MRINISKHRSKSIEEFRGKDVDPAVLVCESSIGVICPFCSSPIVGDQPEIIDETLIGANHYLHRPFNNSSEVVGNNSETPCGMKCVDCYRYKNAWCLGCPASKDYKNPMLKLSNF